MSWVVPALSLLALVSLGRTAELQKEPTYVVVAPTKVRPNQMLKVSATILKLEYESFTVTAVLRKLIDNDYKEVVSGKHTFTRAGSYDIKMKTLENMSPGNYTIRVAGFSDRALQGQIFSNDTEIFFDGKQVSTFIQTSKPFYRQGQTVRFRVIPVQHNLLPVSTTMDVRIMDPNGYVVREWFAQHTNAGGVVSLAYPLSHNLLSYGDWLIEVEVLEYKYNKTFRVEEFYAPLFYVNVSMPTYMLRNSYGLSGLIASNHTTGRGTKGNATVILEIISLAETEKAIPVLQRTIPYFDGRTDFLFTRSEMERAAGGDRALIGKELRITGKVMDWFYNTTAVGFQSAIVYSEDVQLKFLGGSVWTFKPSLPFKVYIAAVKRDGSPLDPYNENRTINLDIIETHDIIGERARADVVEISTDTSVAEYWIKPTSTLKRILITARYRNLQDSRRELVASRYWSPNNYYIQLSTPTKRPTVGEYMVFNVQTNSFIDKVYYYIISGGVIIISDELQMYSRNKLFSVALSRDMAPSARILAYLIAPDGQVVADSLNFHVNGSKLHQMSVKFNRGKDFSYNTVEITATADPLSYVAFSAIEYQLYELGAKNGLTWEEVYEELYSYDDHSNSSLRHHWQRNGQLESSFYAPSPSFGYDANTTFFFSGLYIFTDANASAVYTHCNKTEGRFPCMDGRNCYNYLDICTYRPDCPGDHRDEMGCTGNETYGVKLYNDDSLWRTKHIGAFFQDGGFMWTDQFTKPDGRVDIRVKVPTFPTTWVVSGFAMSRENGLAVLPVPARFDGVRPMFISVQGPKRIKQGEHMSLRISVFNYWDEEMDILVSIKKSADYKFAAYDVNRGSTEQAVAVDGEHQVLVPVFPGGNRQVNIPVVAKRFGHIAIPITASSFVGGHTVMYHVYVEFNGVPEHYVTSTQVDLRKANSKKLQDLKINVSEFLTDQETRLQNYVPGSPRSTVSVIGDIIGVSFYPYVDYDLNSENMLSLPYGTGSEAVYNFAVNLYTLKMLRALSNVNAQKINRAVFTLNIALQEMLTYMRKDGGFKEFRWKDEASTWLTAQALHVMSEGKDRMKDLEKSFQIPVLALNKIAIWLTNQQDVNGSYHEVSSVLNRRFTSTATLSDGRLANLSLTALCVNSLIQATELTNEARSIVDQSVIRGAGYLDDHYDATNDPFEQNIITYALLLSSKTNRNNALRRTRSLNRNPQGTLHYWSTHDIPFLTVETGTDTQQRYLPKQYSNVTAYAVAATSYALLAFMENNEGSDATDPIQKFLQQQHMHVGGFASTQDTLIAMQALKTLAEKNQDRNQYHMSFVFQSDQVEGWSEALSLTQDNWFDLQRIQWPTYWGNVISRAEGHGIALVQLETRVNHEHIHQLRQPPHRVFELQPDFNKDITTSGFNHSYIHYNLCPKWVGPSDRSGMAVLEVGIPSGYIVHNKTLQALVKKRQSVTSLRNAEYYADKAVLYFDYLDPSNANCVNFSAFRWFPVANITEQHFIKVFEYYEPGNFLYTLYEKIELTKLTVCLVCGSYQCPYCPYYASGESVKPSVMLTLLTAFIAIVYTQLFLSASPGTGRSFSKRGIGKCG